MGSNKSIAMRYYSTLKPMKKICQRRKLCCVAVTADRTGRYIDERSEHGSKGSVFPRLKLRLEMFTSSLLYSLEAVIWSRLFFNTANVSLVSHVPISPEPVLLLNVHRRICLRLYIGNKKNFLD